jgi:hypothetical protein
VVYIDGKEESIDRRGSEKRNTVQISEHGV